MHVVLSGPLSPFLPFHHHHALRPCSPSARSTQPRGRGADPRTISAHDALLPPDMIPDLWLHPSSPLFTIIEDLRLTLHSFFFDSRQARRSCTSFSHDIAAWSSPSPPLPPLRSSTRASALASHGASPANETLEVPLALSSPARFVPRCPFLSPSPPFSPPPFVVAR